MFPCSAPTLRWTGTAWPALLLAAIALAPRPLQGAWRVEGNPIITGRTGLDNLQPASDGDGGAVVLFVSLDAPRLGLQRCAADGRVAEGWRAGGAVVDSTYGGWRNLLSDGSGGAFVSWRRFSSGHVHVAVQHIGGDGTVAAGWPGTGAVAVDGYIGPANLSLANDGNGGCFVAWQDFRHGYTGHQDPYLQRISAGGAIATGWPAGGLPLCEAAGDQFDPVLVEDGEGGVIAAWWDYRDSTSSGYDIYATRLKGDGTRAAGWTEDGTAVSRAALHQLLPAICTDGSGGAFIAWSEVPYGDVFSGLGIHLQRLTSGGAVAGGWPGGGIGIGPQRGGAEWIQLVPDGSGGVYAGWFGPTGPRLAHITAHGTAAAGWPADGMPLDEGAWEASAFYIASDGAGGVLACTNVGGPRPTAVLRRMTGRGERFPAWPAENVVLDLSTAFSGSPIVSDGSGGAILTWVETRGDSARTEAYAQRVSGEGVVAPGWEGYPESAWLGTPSPNPGRGLRELQFALPSAAPVSLEVFDARGALVATLLEGEPRHAGRHRLAWSGLGARGQRLPSGVYFLRLRAGSRDATQRLCVLH